jgi:hypothetical protein
MILRFAPTLMADFPVNDGGMFLDMIRDLRASGYALPQVTSYNRSDIPFAYPPFGFYLARLLADIGIDEVFLLRFLPALASTAMIFGVFLFAREATSSEEIGAYAALIHALAPRSYAWLVMGGGLTRSLGFSFMIFMGWALLRAWRDRSRKGVWRAGLFAALTVLSHPEAGIHAVMLGVLLWCFYGHSRSSAMTCVYVAILALLGSSLWWGALFAMHGLGPLLSVINTGMQGLDVWHTFVKLLFPGDSELPLLAFVFLSSLLWGAWRGKIFLVLFALLPAVVQPRSALNVMSIPLAILTAELIVQVGEWTQSHKLFKRPSLPAFILLVYLFAEGYFFGYRLANTSLEPADRVAMQWVAENIPIEGRFVILTGVPAPELDSFQEWFPALSGHRSLTTFQGTEWTLGPEFFVRFRNLIALQACSNVECVQGWVEEHSIEFDYLLVRRKTVSERLIMSLIASGDYRMLYEDDAVVLFNSP